MLKLSLAIAATVGLAVVATPAAAYDPCQRALDRESAARDDYFEWCSAQPGRGCRTPPGSYGRHLYNLWMDATDRRSRACN